MSSLLDCFWGLADGDAAKRVEAAVSLQLQVRKGDADYVVRRLVSGLQSSRLGARRGFGAALGALLESGQVDGAAVDAEALKQVELCPAKDKKQERCRELALVLCALALDSVSEAFAEKLLEIVEKRKWLREAATRALVSLCGKGCEQSMRAVSAHCLLERSNDSVAEWSPERVALAATCGALRLDDEQTISKLDKPLALGAACFPQTHVAWTVAMNKVPPELFPALWNCVDKHVASGTLERRGAALVLAAQTALDTDDPRAALSPSVAKCLALALKSKRSHLHPLALRLTKQLTEMSSKKPDEWRVAAAASLLAARVDSALVEPLLENVDDMLYAGVLVDLVYSGQQPRAMVSLRARSKHSEPAALAALVASLRLVFFSSSKPPSAKKILKKTRNGGGLDEGLAQKLAAPLPESTTTKIPPLEFWALVADRFGSVTDKTKWIRLVAEAYYLFDSDDLDTTKQNDLPGLWIICELRYGQHDEEEDDILLNILNAPPQTALEAAKRACALLGVAHGTETSRPARLVVNNLWASECARYTIDADTISYLVQMVCGEERADDDEEEEEEEEDEDEEEEDEEDEDDEEEDEEDEDDEEVEEGSPSKEEDDDEEDDVMLDAAGLAEYLGSSNEAASALLSARQAHRKSGLVQAQKLELQLNLRVLDLLERALKRSEDSGEAVIDASAKLAALVRRLEKFASVHSEARDLIKRVLALTGKLRSYTLKKGPELREVAAKTIEELAPSRGPPSYALAACHACALACRAFSNAEKGEESFVRAVSAYGEAARDCLGKKRSGVRPSLLKDAVVRAPSLAAEAFLPVLPDLVRDAPSTFLRLEAISLARDLSSSTSKNLDAVCEAVAEAALSQEEWNKTERARALVECVLALADRASPTTAKLLTSSVARYTVVANKITTKQNKKKKRKRSARPLGSKPPEND